MRISYIRTGFLFGCLALLLWSGTKRWGVVPPMITFLNPAVGFWQQAEPIDNEDNNSKTVVRERSLSAEKLNGSVRIQYDNNLVPHIFADQDEAAYWAQGFTHARHRLWQMEMLWRSPAGRLSEVFGSVALRQDRYHRQLGVAEGAERMLEKVENDESSNRKLSAYTQGVNAYIDLLSEADYPIEYKLFNIAPSRWSILKSIYVIKNMALQLTSGNSEVRYENTRALLGEDAVNNVVDRQMDKLQPIIPDEISSQITPSKEIPKRPENTFTPRTVNELLDRQPHPDNGSNNWAVAGSKTASGLPILANDPHLSMSIPSIWFLNQLSYGDTNVKGVSIPGIPAIVIGFNEDIAWGLTNTGADVFDLYEIEYTDNSKTAYVYADSSRSVRTRIEQIPVFGRNAITDTIRYTHFGPVISADVSNKLPLGYAIRWLPNTPSNEFKTLFEINEAQNYQEYTEALKYHSTPAQNFVFASTSGDIAIWANGDIPIRFPGQGTYLSDGRDPAYEWQGFVPHNEKPHMKNPERGFVSSANQPSAGEAYPYYLDNRDAGYSRGNRVNNLLAEMSDVTAEDMMNMQLDTYSIRAERGLPPLLSALDTTRFGEIHRQALYHLKEWDYRYTSESIAGTMFDEWTDEFIESFLDEWQQKDIPLAWPLEIQVFDLIHSEDERSRLADRSDTEKVETFTDIATESYMKAIDLLKERYGQIGSDWFWYRHNRTALNHVTYLNGFGTDLQKVGGRSGALNAINGNHGPSWRMVVEMGETPQARGIYPGGQSGNPGSPYYLNWLDEWAEGTFIPVTMHTESTSGDNVSEILTINGEED